MADLQDNIQPGWDCKIDLKTGRQYFINHYTKSTTWEDPRNRLRHGTPLHISTGHHEYIPLQHGSPDLRRNSVYPSQQSPIPAFQMPGQYIPLQELKSTAHMSPLSVRTSRIQDTTFSNSHGPDESVVKISSMFPTVSETHIRLLLKKYMKSIFPEVEETMILDILSSNENNIQKASDSLKQMGFTRQDPAKLKLEAAAKAKEEERKILEEIAKIESPPPLPKIISTQEKEVIKESLQNQYKDVPEQVILMALDSVDYNEETAIQILEIMVKGDNKMKEDGKVVEEVKVEKEAEEMEFLTVPNIPASQSRQSLKSLLKEKSDNPKTTFSRVIEENNMNNADFKSISLSNTNGSNPEYAKGANEKLLLEDYVKWQGPNPKLHSGCNKSLAKGPNKSLLGISTYKACGPNPDLHKGPMFGLAKGSIFSQLKHVVLGESRGQ